ncbi:MAG: formylglycine-generating enzyme family protein [Anaerolineae bacterium]
MNGNEARHLQELIRAKKDRLHQLELKEAMFGLDIPPHVPIEIEKLRGEIAGLQAQLAALEKEQKAASRLEEARRQVPAPARPRRPINWEKVGAIAGAMALLIALGTWLVPNAADFFSAWLSETPAVTPTSSPTHTPVISAATPVPPTDTPTPIPPTPAPVLPTETPIPSAPPGMVLVPAGEFIMGSSDSDPDAADDEKPQHTVYLDAFYIDKYEVTNAQYRACVEAGTCAAPADTTDYDHADYAQHPVVYVSWNDADTYCRWAGKRLPTEAEWEKAARGMDGWIYPWGNAFDGGKLNFCDANCTYDWKDASANDGYAATAPVGRFPAGASPYGALDMAGNVWEWVADWYDSGYYSQSPGRNPPGPDSGEDRVLRGTSWLNNQWGARCTARYRDLPRLRSIVVGFRCVRGSP